MFDVDVEHARRALVEVHHGVPQHAIVPEDVADLQHAALRLSHRRRGERHLHGALVVRGLVVGVGAIPVASAQKPEL
jgi:hypothetical protein